MVLVVIYVSMLEFSYFYGCREMFLPIQIVLRHPIYELKSVINSDFQRRKTILYDTLLIVYSKVIFNCTQHSCSIFVTKGTSSKNRSLLMCFLHLLFLFFSFTYFSSGLNLTDFYMYLFNIFYVNLWTFVTPEKVTSFWIFQ